MSGTKTLPDDVILASVDVEDVARKYLPGEEIRQHRMRCPFHGGTHPNLRVDNGRYYCFVCHESGNAIRFVEQLLHMNHGGAKRQIAADFGLGDGYRKRDQSAIDRIAAERKAQAEADRKRKQEETERYNKLCDFYRFVRSLNMERTAPIEREIETLLNNHLDEPFTFDTQEIIDNMIQRI